MPKQDAPKKPAQAFDEGPAPTIPMVDVESHQIKSVGFEPATNTLAVTFTRGTAIYHYPDTPDMHQAFLAAESKGKFFEQHIRPLPFKKYRGEPVAA